MLLPRIAALFLLVIAPCGATETVTLCYDALGRVTRATHAGSVNNGQQTIYKLDAAGNRVTTTTSGASP